ncbi:MAG: TonB-dependent receptor [Acidobacteriia bacterium]|nr:TonB-dependent receptor [Terriglobia bacterium]
MIGKQVASSAFRAFARGQWLFCLVLPGVLFQAAPAVTQQKPDLTEMSLEELSRIQVTSVSKKEQKLNETAAAVFVITAQDIRNSTATSVPELLPAVPGLEVSQINGTRWAISARGFAEQFANKTLILIDGRSVFDPLFSGVLWSEQIMLLEDIERIEVIRGPGATVWGTNAVNGVINIITKRTKDTQGLLLSAGAGDRERSYGAVRYGGKLGGSVTYRIYSEYFDHGPAGEFSGQDAHDSWRATSGGFRIDASTSDRNAFMLEGRAFGSKAGVDDLAFSYTPPHFSPLINILAFGGENLLGQWVHKSQGGPLTTFQVSYAHFVHPETPLDVNGNRASVSIQHERHVGALHDIVFGAEFDYRNARTSMSLPMVFWTPNNPSFHITSGFLQDEMVFANGGVHVTAGLRVEHNSLSGISFQPNGRILWKVNSVHSLWAAYSLAVRSNSPTDTSVNVNIAAFTGPAGTRVLRLTPNPRIEQEKLNAFELGYRVQPAKSVSLDVATFCNQYSDLLGSEPGQPFFEAGPPRLVIPLVSQNDISGRSFGGELTTHWVPTHAVHLTAAYSFIELDLTQSSAAGNRRARSLEGPTPRHKLSVSSSVDLVRNLTFNTAFFFVDRKTTPTVPGYAQMDSNLTWRPLESTQFSIGAKNLFNKEHVEFISSTGGLSTLLGRSVYCKATWRF